MKKLLRHAKATVLPALGAKVVSEGKRAWRIYKRRFREVREEKRES